MKIADTVATADSSVDHCPDWLVLGLEWVQTLSDLIGLAAISMALFVSAVRWIVHEIQLLRTPSDEMKRWKGMQGIRFFLGNYILFGLEFMIVSDIIHSFLQPDLLSLGTLGLLVLIRTMISYFLGKEIEMVHQEDASQTPH